MLLAIRNSSRFYKTQSTITSGFGPYPPSVAAKKGHAQAASPSSLALPAADTTQAIATVDANGYCSLIEHPLYRDGIQTASKAPTAAAPKHDGHAMNMEIAHLRTEKDFASLSKLSISYNPKAVPLKKSVSAAGTSPNMQAGTCSAPAITPLGPTLCH